MRASLTLSVLWLSLSLVISNAASFNDTLKPFLGKYCTDCHGPKEQKGDRRFDVLPPDISDHNTLADYQDILDQLNLSEMPPGKATQPSDAERSAVIDWLTSRIARFHRQHGGVGTQTVLRRLNAREYRNTLRDLLHLDMTMFDPTTKFPKDQSTHQLDNIGNTLITSGFLLVQYLEAAEIAIDKALLTRSKPPVQKWNFTDNLRQQPEIDQVHRRTTLYKHLTLYDVVGADKHEGAYAPIHAFKEGVPIDGFYEIRFEAQAANRINPYDPEFLGMDPQEPLRLGIVPGDHTAGQLHKPQPVEPLLTEMDIADETRWYSVRVWMDKGFTPRFTFRNGLMDVRSLYRRLIRKYPDQFPKDGRKGIVADRYNAIRYGKMPQIHINEIEIKGPFYESWPTAGQRALLGEDCEDILTSGSLGKEKMRTLLGIFLARAYRRPVREGDIDRIMQVVETRMDQGHSSLDAYADGLKAALCSPHFIYLDQTTSADRLSATALATRLSYFLWSTMPDDTLRELAASGALKKPDVLRSQVLRLLEDKRSAAFVDGFLGSWLNLRALGSTPPDRSAFRDFYHYDLGTAMRRETQLFTRHLINENLDIIHFLDSDFTFVNKPLARLYGIDAPESTTFQKVAINDRRRGGLFGQSSILTVTANGIDTSPVVRGVWVLENILGSPPAPPPPDVEPLDPDIRGAKTIRDQLKKHRDVASCYECHRKIDPLGFALENFDPIGRWRESYGRNAKVDAAGELPNGEPFNDIRDLKRILVKHRSKFAKALTEKLLSYATGREVTATDRPAIDALLKRAAAKDHGFRDLIALVADSEPFRSK